MATYGRSGHRARIRKNYFANGIEGTEDTNVVELYLSLIIPQKDVKPIAYNLMNRFGSIENIFTASYEDLIKVDGIGENTAATICLSGEYIMDKVVCNTNSLLPLESKLNYVRNIALDYGDVVIALTNSKNQIIDMVIVKNYGNMDIELRTKIISIGLNGGAHFFIARYTDNVGNTMTSYDTKMLIATKDTLRTIGICIQEYIIFNEEDSFVVSKSEQSNLIR